MLVFFCVYLLVSSSRFLFLSLTRQDPVAPEEGDKISDPEGLLAVPERPPSPDVPLANVTAAPLAEAVQVLTIDLSCS